MLPRGGLQKNNNKKVNVRVFLAFLSTKFFYCWISQLSLKWESVGGWKVAEEERESSSERKERIMIIGLVSLATDSPSEDDKMNYHHHRRSHTRHKCNFAICTHLVHSSPSHVQASERATPEKKKPEKKYLCLFTHLTQAIQRHFALLLGHAV